jgi:hypothetical protein
MDDGLCSSDSGIWGLAVRRDGTQRKREVQAFRFSCIRGCAEGSHANSEPGTKKEDSGRREIAEDAKGQWFSPIKHFWVSTDEEYRRMCNQSQSGGVIKRC